jgi:hypothetical protein
MNYYGAFYPSALYPLLARINAYLLLAAQETQTRSTAKSGIRADQHLAEVLVAYAEHYNDHRPHQSDHRHHRPTPYPAATRPQR